MNSRMSYEETREALIRELIAQKLAIRLRLIATGDTKAIHDAANDVFDYLAYSKDAERLVTGEVTFQQVRDKVLENDCEVEAVKEVEAMEKRRAESEQWARIERRAFDRQFGVPV
jgi:hypothetical protein